MLPVSSPLAVERSRPHRWSLLLLTATLIVGGCGRVGTTNNTTAASSASDVAGTSSSQAGWSVSRATDPMSDVVVHTAAATLADTGYKAATRIECGGDRVSYTLDVVHPDGSPARMLVNYGRIAGQYRLDDQRAVLMSQLPTAIGNRFYFFSLEPSFASATTLLVRMSLAEGTATFTIDQNDAALRPMLRECAATMQAQIEAANAKEEAYQRERARCGGHACPIIPPDDAPAARDALPPSMSDADLKRMEECQSSPRAGDDRSDCPALLARHVKFEDEVARRDFELESE